MTINDATGLVSNLLIIEELVKEIQLKKPQLSDQEAFSLAQAMIETYRKSA